MQTERRYLDYREYIEDAEEAISRKLFRVTADADGEPQLMSGYVALYNRFSPVYNKFREQIAPTFFDAVLEKKADVRLLFNHDSNFLLGRTKSGTLRLRSDSVGLWAESDLPKRELFRGLVVEPMQRGDLSGASFSFTLPPEGGQEWRKADDGVWERTLTQAGELFDVGPVTFPFYPETDVGVRGEVRSQLQTAFDRWAEAHPEAVQPPADETDWALIAARTKLAGM